VSDEKTDAPAMRTDEQFKTAEKIDNLLQVVEIQLEHEQSLHSDEGRDITTYAKRRKLLLYHP